MNVFYDIPQIMQVDLLSQWFRPEDVGRLDSATCSHKLRPELLSLFQSTQCYLRTFRFQWTFCDAWIVLRGAKLRELALNHQSLKDSVRRRNVLETIGPHLKCLELRLTATDDEGNALSQAPLVNICLETAHFCRNLESLYITDGTLDLSLSVPLTMCKMLKEVTLQGCQLIPEEVLSAICSAPALETIEIGCCSTFGESAFDFAATGCPTCTSLTLKSLLPSREEVQALSTHLPNLSHLNIEVERLSDLADLVVNCKHVKNAIIFGLHPLTQTDAALIANNWQSLEALHVDYSTGDQMDYACCEEQAVLLLLEKCKCLKTLQLAKKDRLHTFAVPGNVLFSKCDRYLARCGYSKLSVYKNTIRSELQYLSIPCLSERGWNYITTHCPNLHTLHLHRPTDSILLANAAEFALHHVNDTNITSLHLTNCTNLTATNLLQLQTLEKLVLCNAGSTTSLTDTDFVKFVEQCTTLNSLYIHACPGVTHKVILPILAARPGMYALRFCAQYIHNWRYVGAIVDELVSTVRSKYPALRHFDVSTW